MVFCFHAVYCRASLHLHVSILLSTCLFSYAHVFFLLCVWFLLLCHRCLFYANLSFSYVAPLLRMLHGAGGTGGGAPLGAILYAELTFFFAAPVLFLCSMGRFPSISMSLPPSSCLHPVVDMFVCLCPRVFLLCVWFLLLCHRCLFYANLSFSYVAPPSSYAPRRRWDGGEGHPFARRNKQTNKYIYVDIYINK